VVQSDKEASQTRDYCVAKSATHRAARPDSSLRKRRLFGMTTSSRSSNASSFFAHFCATVFWSTNFGSANCSQKPIISSSLGSPQRTAFEGSGFCGLSNELSK
jgi:hypothetical protein